MSQMNTRILLPFLLLAIATAPAQSVEDFSTMRGANYVPSYARNDVQTWMDYDPVVIDRELGYAAELKLNTLRVFLNVPVYERNPKQFLANFENFLGLCAKHRIRMMPVLFDSCFGEFPDLEQYRDKDWMANPGQNRLGPEHWPAMEDYVRDVVGGHKDDQRIVLWDVMNEPTCTSFNKPEDKQTIHAFLTHFLDYVRQQDPNHPRCVGFEHSSLNRPFLDKMEVLAVHNYRQDLREDIRAMLDLAGPLGKPVIVNEVVGRPKQGFEFVMPILRDLRVGWCFWELMLGKTQFSRSDPPYQGLVYPDGTCYDICEVAAVMNVGTDEAAKAFPQNPAANSDLGRLHARPRMLYGDATRHGRPFAKDPSVIRLGERYLMYYSMAPSTNPAVPKGWAVGIAESRDLVQWQKVGEILPEQECEKHGLVNGKALLLGGKVHFFYNTYGNGKGDALCHAVSDDGLTFRRDPSNPILRAVGDWNSGRAIDCDAFEYEGKLWLIYATRDPTMKTQMLAAATASLASDFGRTAWTHVGDGPILKPELPWETNCIEAPSVIGRDDALYLFYGGGYNNDPQQIGCAVSRDGLRWTRLFRQPLWPNGQPGDWNESETGHPGAFEDTDSKTYLFVQGNREKGRTWFLSCAEIEWREGRPAVLWDSPKFPMKRPGPAAHHEDDIDYSTGWTCWRGAGPRGGGLHYANQPGCRADITFRGTGLTLIHKTGPDCGIAQVLVDGQPGTIAALDTYSAEVDWNHRTLVAQGLPRGEHTVSIFVTDRRSERSSNAYVQIIGYQQAEQSRKP